MQAHAGDLRAAVATDSLTLVDQATPPDQGDALVHALVDDWRGCPLRAPLHRLLEYVEKLTREPHLCVQADVDSLRAAGWTDEAIHDAVQVAAYFNYINRVADALGVKTEHGLPRWGSHPVLGEHP